MADLRLEPPTPELLDALVALPPRPGEPANVADAITVLWEPGDDGPEQFYLTLGFVPTGEELFGERVGILPL